MSHADLLPATPEGMRVPSTGVFDEANRPHDFRELTVGNKPILLLPAFFKCHASCPVMARALRKATKDPQTAALFRIVVFSFDATDTPTQAALFRKTQNLPPDWLFVRTTQDVAARQFFDAFNYHYRDEHGTFLHPNQIFVLSANGRWAQSITGATFTSSDLESAARLARLMDSTTLRARLERLSRNPEALAVWGMAGLLMSVIVLVFVAFRSKGRSG